jgi:hypothetical protein
MIGCAENSQIYLRYFDVSLTLHLMNCSSFSTGAPDGHLLRVKIPDAVLIQFGLLRMSKVLLKTCRGL